MNERYDDIAEAHKQTFRWIYERRELKFVDWLKAGKGIYWITGKAGCGKSTLMKLLFEDNRTLESLPKDIENTSLSSFFFHDRGQNPLLKSQEGLYRAILYSILSEYRQLIPITLPRRWEAMRRGMLSGGSFYNPMMASWSTTELKEGFKAIASQKVLRLRLCLLIDGLDEFFGATSGYRRSIGRSIALIGPFFCPGPTLRILSGSNSAYRVARWSSSRRRTCEIHISGSRTCRQMISKST